MAQDGVYVYDEGDLRKYRTEIPNLVDDMNLSPHAYRLYGHLKRVAGASEGSCWQNTETLAQICNMATGMVSKAKAELVKAGLIVIGKRRVGKNDVDNIRIIDIWARNFEAYGPKNATPSQKQGTPSQYERVPSVTPSQYETKKKPSQEGTNKEKTSHAEKSNNDFSRAPAERAQQQSLLDDTFSEATEEDLQAVEHKQSAPKKERATKPPREPDALFDAIAEVWQSAPGMTGVIKQQLTGKIPAKNADSVTNFDVPATPDEVRAFGEWYRKTCNGCPFPLSRDKIQNHFYAFRRARMANTRKLTPKTRVANGRLLEYNGDSKKWYDIGPAPIDHQPQYGTCAS